MHKSFENRYGMSYVNQGFKESSWDKMRKGVRCYAGWGQKREEKKKSRFANQEQEIEAINGFLDEFDKAIKKQKREIPGNGTYYYSETKHWESMLKSWFGEMTPRQKSRFEDLKREERELPGLAEAARKKIYGN